MGLVCISGTFWNTTAQNAVAAFLVISSATLCCPVNRQIVLSVVIELNCKATPLFAICRPSWPVSTLRLEHCSIARWLLIDHYLGMPALRTAEGKLRVYYAAVSIVLNEHRRPPVRETSRDSGYSGRWFSYYKPLQLRLVSLFIDCIVRSPQLALWYLGRPGRFWSCCCCCLRRLQLLCMLVLYTIPIDRV